MERGKGRERGRVCACMLFIVRIAREQGTGKIVRGEVWGKSVGSVHGDTFWKGERGVVRREGEKGKKSSGVDFKAGQAVREKG